MPSGQLYKFCKFGIEHFLAVSFEKHAIKLLFAFSNNLHHLADAKLDMLDFVANVSLSKAWWAGLS